MAALTFYYKSPFSIPVPIIVLSIISFPESYDRYLKILSGFAVGILAAGLLAHTFKAFDRGDFEWIKKLSYKIDNHAVVPEQISWVASELVSRKALCVFDLTNNGTINAASGLPACTRFSYLVYADYQYEDEVLDALKKSNPSALVYSTEYWSYAIDGKPMNKRFPRIETYIKSIYRSESCNHGYCIRYK